MAEAIRAEGFVERPTPGFRGTGALLMWTVGVLGFIAALTLLMLLFGTGMSIAEGDRGLLGIALMIAGVASAVWTFGFLWRWGMRRTRQETIRRMLPGFAGRTIPVGGLVSGPKAAGQLEGRYLLAVGADAFLVLRHFHDPARFDPLRGWLMSQMINAYGPDCAATPRPLLIPFAAIADVRLRTLGDDELQKGAFGRAVAHGLASAALDALVGARSLADKDAAFIEIVMKDGESIVFGAPSRTPASLVAALARTADGAAGRGSDDASFREIAEESVTQLLERSGELDEPPDGWSDFFAGLKPEGHRARAFAALGVLRIRQETGREGPRRVSPAAALDAAIAEVAPLTAADRDRVPIAARRRLEEALMAAETPPTEEERVAALGELDARTRDWLSAPPPPAPGRFGHRARLGVWAVVVLVLAVLALAIEAELMATGRAQVTTAASLTLIALAAAIGMWLFAKRSGWLRAGWRSAVTFVAAVGLLMSVAPKGAFADGAGRTVARIAATPFKLISRPRTPAPTQPTAEQVEAARRLAEAARAKDAEAERVRLAAEQEAGRINAAEALVRGVYEGGRDLNEAPDVLRGWLAPSVADLAVQVQQLAARVDFPLIDFDPLVDGQDSELTDFAYETRLTDAGAETVVTFRNFGEPVRLTFSLVETPAGWRVADIVKTGPTREQGYSLEELLRNAVAEAQIALDEAEPSACPAGSAHCGSGF